MTLVLLCGFAFFAGLVDAVAGGGGLIQLPALFLFLPASLTAVPSVVFGTNKLSSICGTAVAVGHYAKRVKIPWHIVTPSAGAAFVFSMLGAAIVTLIRPELLKPLVIGLLCYVAIFTYSKRKTGPQVPARISNERAMIYGICTGVCIGF